MKTLTISLSFAILSLIAVGCKNETNEGNPAPIDQIPGEYKLSITATYTIDGVITTQPGSGTLSVYKGNNPGSYFFVERYPGYEMGYLTTHNNGSFTLQEVADRVLYNGVQYYGYQSGSGSTSANTITFTKATDTQFGPTYNASTGQYESTEKRIKKRVTITAEK